MELMETTQMIEFGPVPEDWTVGTFGDFMDGFSSGMTPYRGNKEYYKGDFPWITSGELNYNVITETNEKITEDAIKKTNLKIVPPGTFLMAVTGMEAEGTRGSCAITGIPATTNQSCMALYPHKGVLETGYLYHFYVLYGKDLALKYSQGTKQQSYNAVTAKRLPIVFPKSLKVQKDIVEVLDGIETYIINLQRAIVKKKEIKTGALQVLLTPKEHWENKRLGEIGEILGGLTYSPKDVSSSGTLVLRSSNIQNNTLTFEDNVFVNMELPERVTVKTNDLLICVRNGSKKLLGKCALIDEENSGHAFGAFMSIFRSEHNRYLYYQFQSKQIQAQIDENIGATINQITNKMLNDFIIPLPSLKEQIHISTILMDIDSEINLLLNKKNKAVQLKKGLMSQLLTGKASLNSLKILNNSL